MSAVEHFRKQSKLHLRWHRQGYFPVAAQIRQYLGRFAGLSDDQILAQPFRLKDAQELVARKAGFNSWQALKEGMSDMTTSANPVGRKATLLAAEPQLFVSDLEESCRFYESQLGFEIVFSYGEPAFYAQVRRDGARLNLRRTSRRAFDLEFRKAEADAISATIAVDDAKPIFLEFKQRGVEFHQRLRTEPWGARTFIVRDPDGNLICFAAGSTVEHPGVGAFAIVPCNDLPTALSFWKRLGFTRTGGADNYLIMTGWGCEVHLTQAGRGPWGVPENNPFGVFIRTPDVEAVAARVDDLIIRPGGVLRHREWGVYEVGIAGPDSLLVRVGWPSHLVR